MSLTAIAWVLLFAILTLGSLTRPVYAVSLYMLTFFAAPHLWWWGDQIPEQRYALIAGLILLGAVIFNVAQSSESQRQWSRAHTAALLVVANATFVHFLIASTPSVSVDHYVELLKFILLFFLFWLAIQDRRDLRIAVIAIALGAAYIGYEVTINERGDFSGSRLEGVGAPGADSSNSLASVMLLTLPLIGTLWVNGEVRHKLTAMVAAPFALNVLILCNSRGAFLGLIGAGLSFLLIARGQTRKQAIKSLALAGVVLYLLLGDPQIFERFLTTFAGSEDRDASAASRFQFWRAGLLMIYDYPLGDGGGAFKYIHGGRYLRMVMGDDAIERSLHNGYLEEATEWGVQGLFLRLMFVGASALLAFRTIKLCRNDGRTADALMGMCFLTAGCGFLIHCVFGSFLSNEWGYWILALMVRYGELYRVPESALAHQEATASAEARTAPPRLAEA
jgi:hypothetical protein